MAIYPYPTAREETGGFYAIAVAVSARGGKRYFCPKMLPLPHLCCIAHKKQTKSRFCGQIYDWKHLYLRFFAVRRYVIPS